VAVGTFFSDNNAAVKVRGRVDSADFFIK